MKPLLNGTPMQWAGGYLAMSVLLGGIAVCGTAGSLGQPPLGKASRGATPEAWLLNDLDRLIQDRFQVIDYKNFGVSRLVIEQKPAHPAPLRWNTSTATERTVSSNLKRADWDAVILVAGLTALDPPRQLEIPKESQSNPAVVKIYQDTWNNYLRRQLSPPVLLTGAAPAAPLPPRDELLPKVREALQSEPQARETTFRSGAWTFVARPIRAGKAECLNCHKGQDKGKVGDVLGVAVYGFTPRGVSTASSR